MVQENADGLLRLSVSPGLILSDSCMEANTALLYICFPMLFRSEYVLGSNTAFPWISFYFRSEPINIKYKSRGINGYESNSYVERGWNQTHREIKD